MTPEDDTKRSGAQPGSDARPGAEQPAESTPSESVAATPAQDDVARQQSKPAAQSASPERDAPGAAGRRPEDPESADDTMTKRLPGHEEADAAVLEESRRHTRRAFALAAVGAAAGYGFWRWVERPNPSEDDQPIAIRRALQTNAALSRGIFDERALAPTYSLHRAENLRVNGVYGLKQALVPESWRLQVVGTRDPQKHSRYAPDVTAWEYRYTAEETHEDKGHDTKVDPAKEKADAAKRSTVPAFADTAEKMAPEPMVSREKARQERTERMPRGQEEAGESDSTLKPGTPGLLLTLDDLKPFPRHELVTQFKCIEGWSQIVHWAGIRLSDFLDAYPPAAMDGREPRFVYMETPNGDYYVGYNMDICRHPQTLLVTEMMGAPLTQFHGAPLRIHMPTKYGYKQIKRIGLIAYMDEKPDDYWTKLGYDWYAGL